MIVTTNDRLRKYLIMMLVRGQLIGRNIGQENFLRFYSLQQGSGAGT